MAAVFAGDRYLILLLVVVRIGLRWSDFDSKGSLPDLGFIQEQVDMFRWPVGQ